MNTTQKLIQNLTHQRPEARKDAALILGMVQEVDAYAKLAQVFKRESEPAVKPAMQWAGRQLQAAIAQKHSTFQAIWQTYHIYREVSGEQEQYVGMEQDQFAFMLDQTHADIRMEQLMSGPLSSKKSATLSQVPSTFFDAPKRRNTAVEPTKIEIRPHLRRLQDPSPENRRKAALTLRDLNNPAALSALATATYQETVAAVRDAAQQAGKALYWGMIYWQLEQDGTIERIIEQQRAKNPAAKDPNATTEAEKIEAIFKRKQQRRK